MKFSERRQLTQNAKDIEELYARIEALEAELKRSRGGRPRKHQDEGAEHGAAH